MRAITRYADASALTCCNFLSTLAPPDPSTRGPTPAFAFDIDGVLKRGRQAIPQAPDAITAVSRAGWPFVFLTNGGGSTEASRAEYLSSLLHCQITPKQVIMAHTPMTELLPRFATESVLVCGRGESLQAAWNYGFSRALSPLQLAAALGPDAVPFSQIPTPAEVAEQLGQPCPVQEYGAASADSPIRAIMVFTDPDDWSRDLQLCFDVIQHNGVLIGSAAHSPGTMGTGVAVYFGQDDLLWSNSFHAPRFGLGAFRRALSHLHMEATQRALVIESIYGKPTPKPYKMAQCLLDKHARLSGWSHAEPIYMVGDNPEVDVRGANDAGHPWRSVLVRTGVFRGCTNYDQ
eukprot:jgi/Ulvmu1/6165/UM028_0021.1